MRTTPPPAELQELAAAFAAHKPRIGRNRVALPRLRERRHACGLCWSASRAFARFCRASGVPAAASGWLKPTSLGFPYGDRLSHTVCLVSCAAQVWVVDWTAAQFDSAEFPRITPASPELARDFALARAA